MGDEIEASSGISKLCRPPAYEPPSDGAPAPTFFVDSPHGLAANVESLESLFLPTLQDPNALIETLGLLPQILDRPGSVFEVSLRAPLVKGEFLDGISVRRDGTEIVIDLKIRDGYLDGEINFYPPVIQRDFQGSSDIPSHVPFGWSHAKMDVNLHRLKITTDNRVTHIKALTSYASFYFEPDVTEMISKRYLGTQIRGIDFPMSELFKKGAAHLKTHPMNMNMADVPGARFNVKISSGGTLPPYDGPYQACVGGVNQTCNSLQFHWNHLALGKTLSVHDVDVQVFVFPNPETGGLDVAIPVAKVGQVVQNLGNGPAATLSNARFEDVVLELVPKDPSRSLDPLDMYPKRIKGTIRASGLSAFEDIEVASLGTGIEFEIFGDAKGNLWTENSKPIAIPGLILSKADLVLRGAGAIHAADAALLDGQIGLQFRDGVLSYSASIVPGLECGSFSGVLEQLGIREIKGAAAAGCRGVSASSQNALFGDHVIRLDRCRGALSGAAGLLSPLPLDITTGVSFRNLDASATVGPESFTLDHMKLPDFELGVRGEGKGFEAGFHLEDGAKRLFHGIELPPGLVLETGEDGILTAKTNVVNGLSLSGGPGSFRSRGVFVGTADLVNVSSHPFVPDFRPVAGSLDFDINAGASLTVFGQIIPLRSKTQISDDATGRGILTNRTFVAKPLPVNSATTVTFDLSDSVKEHNGVSYYDLPDGLKLAFSSRVSEKHVGNLDLWGYANVAGLKSGNFRLDLGATVPLDQREINVPGGKIRISAGKITASGNEQRIDFTVKPPEKVEIRLDQVIDGVTYEIRGSLTSKGSFHAGLRLSDGRFTLEQRQPEDGVPLEGNLNVVARKDGKIVGAGEVSVSVPYQLDGWSNPQRGRLTIKFPEKMVIPVKVPEKTTGEETVPKFTIGELTLNPGDNVSIPIEMPQPIVINFSIRNLLEQLK